MPASLVFISQVIWSLFLWETSPVPRVTPSPLDAPLLILLSALEVPTPKKKTNKSLYVSQQLKKNQAMLDNF